MIVIDMYAQNFKCFVFVKKISMLSNFTIFFLQGCTQNAVVHWFKSYGNFSEWVGFAYWYSIQLVYLPGLESSLVQAGFLTAQFLQKT